jgi:hypothetical protein
METIQKAAERIGSEAALKWADHRIECLEAEIRGHIQALRALSDAVLNGEDRLVAIARAAKEMLETNQSR